MSRALRTLCACAVLFAFAARSWAADPETVAVISSEASAYLEAFTAFQKAYGAPVRLYNAAKGRPEIPKEVRTVVAFGSRAASQNYPSRLNLIYTMAPGLRLDPKTREGKSVSISVLPDFGLILSKLKALQPGLKKLYIFWTLREFDQYLESGAARGTELGIEVKTVRARTTEELPALLRQSLSDMDAFWLPPDPFLLNAETLTLLREFSWGNSVPFYAPTKGITREGATASVAISFSEMGISAAKSVKAVHDGSSPAAVIHPDRVELTLNRVSAKKCHLEPGDAALRQVDQFFP